MPFKSKKQRNYLKWKKPSIYNRWKKEHGTKIKKDRYRGKRGGKKTTTKK